MAGTKAGALKAKNTIIDRFGEGFYGDIAKIGGKAKVPKGFAKSGKAREAGIIGGAISRKDKPRGAELYPFWLTYGGEGALRNRYSVLVAKNEAEARAKVFEVFGYDWDSLYSKEEWYQKNGKSIGSEYGLKFISIY